MVQIVVNGWVNGHNIAVRMATGDDTTMEEVKEAVGDSATGLSG